MSKFIYQSWCFLIVITLIGTQTGLAKEKTKPTARNRVRLALMRAVPEKWKLESNYQLFEKAVSQAAQKKANVLITPECWLDGYASTTKDSTPEKIRTVAQPLDQSKYLKNVARLAKKHHMFICFGFTSLEKGRAFNASGLWSDQGKLIGVYHKTHLQAHDLQYAPGRALPVWNTPWGKVGMMICADRRWPETARTLRLQGARLILNPTYGFHNDLNEAMMRTRSYENQCFIAFTHPKQSLVTGPRGQVLANQDDKNDKDDAPQILICDINLSQAKENNHLQDRRPEIYGPLNR
ncbi:carbon-nitrogen hydrolase family protein [Gimesia aquarii]|uniref:N-carbamoyl-D-amino acid hydrolase n=1 Tax=Gimesia aquarii TaxID=2527964 RepID=A0A517VYZ5_9PLAN|nr:carbon-nitrogen hydrolase family protein [Gimesia aquarii]QDT98217.1 N-carbamoyl-D-amino acid hydrolase [Gimesia aquarii]